MKKLKYDYTELDEYLVEDRPGKVTITYSFLKLIEGYTKMATFILCYAPEYVSGRLTVDPESADFLQEYIEIFRILERLPEASDESLDPDPAHNQAADISSMAEKYGIQERKVQSILLQEKMHRAFIELEKNLPDHIENLYTIFEGFKTSNPEMKLLEGVTSEEETYKMLLEYLERWVQYQGKLWSEE